MEILLHEVLEGIYGDYYFKVYQNESMATTTSQVTGRNLWRLLLQRVPEEIYGDYYFKGYQKESMETTTSTRY